MLAGNALPCIMNTSTTEMQTMKTVTLYEIRYWPTPTAYSKGMGRKLRTRKNAAKLVKRLKKAGYDVFSVPMRIAA